MNCRIVALALTSVVIACATIVRGEVTVVTPGGDPTVPSGFFTSSPLKVDFDASLPDGGIPAEVAFVSGSGVVGSPSFPGPFTAAAWDYAAESPTSNVWALASEGLVFNFPSTPASEVGLLFTDTAPTGATVTLEAWSGPGGTGDLLATVSAFRGSDGTVDLSFADDCFYGIKEAGSIGSIRLWGDNGQAGIEGDVLRVVFVPEPGTALGFFVVLTWAGFRRRF